jgi:hypothetical protein
MGHIIPAFIVIDTLAVVMAGLVPAIHAFDIFKQGVDARNKCGHDESIIVKLGICRKSHGIIAASAMAVIRFPVD